jgi:hypothetical protein
MAGRSVEIFMNTEAYARKLKTCVILRSCAQIVRVLDGVHRSETEIICRLNDRFEIYPAPDSALRAMRRRRLRLGGAGRWAAKWPLVRFQPDSSRRDTDRRRRSRRQNRGVRPRQRPRHLHPPPARQSTQIIIHPSLLFPE